MAPTPPHPNTHTQTPSLLALLQGRTVLEDRPVVVAPFRVRPAPPAAARTGAQPRPLDQYAIGEAVDVASGGAWVECYVVSFESTSCRDARARSSKQAKGQAPTAKPANARARTRTRTRRGPSPAAAAASTSVPAPHGTLHLATRWGSKSKPMQARDARFVRASLEWVASDWAVAPPKEVQEAEAGDCSGSADCGGNEGAGSGPRRAPPLRSSARVDAFYRFLYERHAAWERRARGLPPPWTDDPILHSFRFCNIFRELDTGTKYFAQEVARQRARASASGSTLQLADLVFMTVAYRLLNRVETFADSPTGVPTRAEWPALRKWLQEEYRRSKGASSAAQRKFGTGAHQTVGLPIYVRHMNTKAAEIEVLLRECGAHANGHAATSEAETEVSEEAETGLSEEAETEVSAEMDAGAQVGPRGAQATRQPLSTEGWTDALQTLAGVGPFFAWQCCCDLQEAGVAPRDALYARLGNGACAGLLCVYPREKENARSAAEGATALLPALLRLQAQREASYARMGLEAPTWEGQELEAKEIEHTLCEYAKYTRMSAAGDHSRMLKYVPNGMPAPFGERKGDEELVARQRGGSSDEDEGCTKCDGHDADGRRATVKDQSAADGLAVVQLMVETCTPIALAARLAQLAGDNDGEEGLDDDVPLPEAAREVVRRLVLRRVAASQRGGGGSRGLTQYVEGRGCSKCRYSPAGCINCKTRAQAYLVALEEIRARNDELSEEELHARAHALGWAHSLGGWLTPQEAQTPAGQRKIRSAQAKVRACTRARAPLVRSGCWLPAEAVKGQSAANVCAQTC